MKGFFALVRRDVVLAVRQGGASTMAVVFFVMAVTLFPLGVGPEIEVLRRISSGVIWVAALLSCLLEIAGRLPKNIFRHRLVHQVLATPVHDIGVDLEPVIFVGKEHLRLFRQHYAKVSYRKFGNLALHFQEVLNLLIEAARYYVHTPLGVDQLGYNP